MLINNLRVMLGDTCIINTITLDLKPGAVHVLMGPNGSGKSSLAYALMGHPKYTISNGSVELDGTDISTLPVEKRARAGIFLACQYPQEIPGVSVGVFLKEAHRMLTGQELSVAEFRQLLYTVFDAVALDYSFIDRPVNEGFSGGEKKRLELAQLLLFKPKVAILDELDSGLDIDALKLVFKALDHVRSVQQNMRILLITHYCRIFDYIEPTTVSILSNGTIIASGDKQLAYTLERKGYDGLLL